MFDLTKSRKHYPVVEVDCFVQQKLDRKTYERILTILDRPIDRFKDYADLFVFSLVPETHSQALMDFLISRKIQHRWEVKARSVYKKSSCRSPERGAWALG